MHEWNRDAICRLYELYENHVSRLRKDVIAANVSLGSSNPEKTSLASLTRGEFEQVLIDPSQDREAIDLWVQRIIRGHEQEFSDLQAAS